MLKCSVNCFGKFYSKIKRFLSSFLPSVLGHSSLENESSTLNLDELYNKKDSTGYNELPRALRKPSETIDKLANFTAGKTDFSSPLKNSKKPMIVGLIVMAIFFLIFCVWAGFAPLKGAILARGKITGTITNKLIQHLEGGIIKEVFVKDGAKVQQGDPLIKIDDVRTKASFQILTDKLIAMNLIKERLIMERNGEKEFVTMNEFIEDMKDDIENAPVKIDQLIFENQKRLFNARTNYHNGQVDIMYKKIDELKVEKNALLNQASSLEQQNNLMQQDIADMKNLITEGYGNKDRLHNLELQHYEILSKIGSVNASISQNEQRTTEAEISIMNTKNEYWQTIERELKEIESNVAELHEQIKSVEDTLERTLIKAPYDGIVSDLKYNTPGSVIGPGSMLMSLIPENDEFIVEVNIMPQDISNLLSTNVDLVNYRYDENSNQEPINVQIKLSTFSSRKVPSLRGHLMQVSPDLIQDPRTGYAFYSAKVMIDREDLENLPKNVALYHGLIADVFILTQPKTFFSYLLMPITASFDRAFLES